MRESICFILELHEKSTTTVISMIKTIFLNKCNDFPNIVCRLLLRGLLIAIDKHRNV